MTEEQISLDVVDGIATITLDRPDRLNAFTLGMVDELVDALDRFDADDEVRAVIVTGAGRGFCAGADLDPAGTTFDVDALGDEVPRSDDGRLRDGGGLVSLRILAMEKPVIAAINGPAAGVGITMTLAMDVRLASTAARFAFPFVRRGIVPEACSSWFLPRLVGPSQALEWCLSGRTFGAEEALAGRLVRSLHEPDDLLGAAIALAEEMTVATAPVSVALTRRLLWHMLGQAHPMDAHRLDSALMESRGRSDDVREGIASFFEKRPAAFPDRISVDRPDVAAWAPPAF